MTDKLYYISYNDMAVIYNREENNFKIEYKGKEIVRNASVSVVLNNGKKAPTELFGACEAEHLFDIEKSVLSIRYTESDEKGMEPVIGFTLNNDGVQISVSGLRNCDAVISGEVFWGENIAEDTFAMCTERTGFDLRCALGPAASSEDNALYDRKTDTAFVIKGGKSIRYKYNWENNCYDFILKTGSVEFQQRFRFYVKEDVIADEYKIDFAPINKNSTFKKPPAGWMTWYAVKFDACEATVLENVRFQQEHLKKYGADAIWVDWEWYHNNINGERFDGVNTFNPDNEKYPNGLKYVSDKIKEAGFIPALWVGFTNDPSDNEYTDENPEIILKNEAAWCGSRFYDFSHPKYLNEFLPNAFKQVFDWGFEAVKYDTLPIALDYHEKYHMNMYNPKLTTKEAFRQMIKKTREIIGKDTYMLSCAAVKDQDVLWAADMFDAARVGNDIFEWNDFIKEGVERVVKFYPLHNIVLYPDPDNIVMREEFNSFDEAASRIYFVSLLGLPMTFGDDFKVLTDDRVELIKKCLPILDIHPMDVKRMVDAPGHLITNLCIELPFESYNVVNVFNKKDVSRTNRIYIDKDLHLDGGEYHIFDFTSEKYLGAVDDFFEAENLPHESRIFCIRKKTGTPQIVSTSRHITQGAAEIKSLEYKENEIRLSAELIEGDEYGIYLWMPDGYTVSDDGAFNVEECQGFTKLTFLPDETKIYKFVIKFTKI